jgi:phosphate transport system protein
VTARIADAPHFADDLRSLKTEVVAMGRLAEERVRLALDGLLRADNEALGRVIAGDDRLDLAQIDIDERCLRLLALFHPVAVDLRIVVSALRINTDVERLGDLAVNIAEAAQRYLLHPPVKPLVDIPRMGDLALSMLRDAIDAFVEQDAAAAYSVLRNDDWLDALNNQIARELLTYMLGNSRVIEPSLDLVLIARHLERIGDHATNIAEDVIFLVQARDVRHRSGPPPGVERRRRSDIAPV